MSRYDVLTPIVYPPPGPLEDMPEDAAMDASNAKAEQKRRPIADDNLGYWGDEARDE